MSNRKLVKGNVAFCYGALAADCDAFFGYPITPQNEVPEYLSVMLPKAGKVFVQAESEVAAINMVYGAAATGKRAMTSSSSPGISLKQEGLSYIAASELPCVMINVQRAGPGLGGILAGQGDYHQTVKGGGHGDYKLITVAPWSVQECYDFVPLAFDLADKYNNPVCILADGVIGQMQEAIELKEVTNKKYYKPWAADGNPKEKKAVINSLWVEPDVLEALNNKIAAKYKVARETEVRFAEYNTEDADLILVAYGTSARICKSVVDEARKNGIKLGLFRPITLFPFPDKKIAEFASAGKNFLVVEMSMGQMIEDVFMNTCGKASVDFYGRTGGNIMTTKEILEKAKEVMDNPCGACVRSWEL